MKTTSELAGASPTLIPRDDVLRRFCRLSARVGTHFNHEFAADCFCPDAPKTDSAREFFAGIGMGDYRFDEYIMSFIERAVTETLEREP